MVNGSAKNEDLNRERVKGNIMQSCLGLKGVNIMKYNLFIKTS